MSSVARVQRVRVEGAVHLEHGAAAKFAFVREGRPLEGFVLKFGDALVAYRNRCPHWTVDLDMGDGRFWSEKLQRIYCKTHGALFQPTTGLCDAGPCVGDRLEKFELEVDGDDAVVLVPGA